MKKAKTAKTFRLDDVYWTLLRAVINNSNGTISTETSALQIAIYELAKKDLKDDQIKEILKKFYDDSNNFAIG